MLLDIGAKTSTVLFFEKGKIYARSISIGANSITQDFATESKVRFNEAEQFKLQHGFVSLGGAYAQAGRQADAAKAFIRCFEINPAMSKAYQISSPRAALATIPG